MPGHGAARPVPIPWL